MTSLVFYDGDGGGFCARMRARFEVHCLSRYSGIEVIDCHPSISSLFAIFPKRRIKPSIENSILLSDLTKHCSTFNQLIVLVQQTSYDYILCGEHQYSSIFKTFLKDFIGLDNSIVQFRSMLVNLGISKDKARIGFQSVAAQSFDVGIHIRSMIDSYDGYRAYKKIKVEFYGWLTHIIYKYSKINRNPTSIFIASDSIKESLLLERYCSCNGMQVTKGMKFNHSSLVSLFGKDLLAKTKDHLYQLNLLSMQQDIIYSNSTLDNSWFVDIARLSNSKLILGTSSSFSQFSYIISENAEYRCFGFECYKDALFS
jgi:hypothetical protein